MCKLDSTPLIVTVAPVSPLRQVCNLAASDTCGLCSFSWSCNRQMCTLSRPAPDETEVPHEAILVSGIFLYNKQIRKVQGKPEFFCEINPEFE